MCLKEMFGVLMEGEMATLVSQLALPGVLEGIARTQDYDACSEVRRCDAATLPDPSLHLWDLRYLRQCICTLCLLGMLVSYRPPLPSLMGVLVSYRPPRPFSFLPR